MLVSRGAKEKKKQNTDGTRTVCLRGGGVGCMTRTESFLAGPLVALGEIDADDEVAVVEPARFERRRHLRDCVVIIIDEVTILLLHPPAFGAPALLASLVSLHGAPDERRHEALLGFVVRGRAVTLASFRCSTFLAATPLLTAAAQAHPGTHGGK